MCSQPEIFLPSHPEDQSAQEGRGISSLGGGPSLTVGCAVRGNWGCISAQMLICWVAESS